jgi:hypothetical protein
MIEQKLDWAISPTLNQFKLGYEGSERWAKVTAMSRFRLSVLYLAELIYPAKTGYLSAANGVPLLLALALHCRA